MDNLEKVEKLREKANITYEEARQTLEECDWDLLDAVIALEAKGKIHSDSSQSYTTSQNTDRQETKSPKQVAESYQSYDKNRKSEKGILKTIWDGFVFLIKKGCENTFIVYKGNRRIMEIPVILLILLMLCSLFLALVAMIIGLFCGYRYCFGGPDLGNNTFNDVMDKAGNAADNIKDEFCKEDAYPKSSRENGNETNTSNDDEQNV